MAATRLTRDPEHAIFGGVCAGIATRYDLDRSLVRVGAVLLALSGGVGIPLYFAAWLLMPAPDLAAEPPLRVARENANDVLAAARRTAATVGRTNPDEAAEQVRRAAREVGRVAEDAARAARDALDRSPVRRGPSAQESPEPATPVSTAQRPAAAARPAARPGGGFKPPETSMPPATPKLPFGDASARGDD